MFNSHRSVLKEVIKALFSISEILKIVLTFKHFTFPVLKQKTDSRQLMDCFYKYFCSKELFHPVNILMSLALSLRHSQVNQKINRPMCVLGLRLALVCIFLLHFSVVSDRLT